MNDMLRMVKTEIWKLKRYHMIWAGVLLMLLSVLLTLFSTTALDGTVWTFSFFTEQVIKNNVTMIFPMCIAFSVFGVCKCGIHGNGRLDDGISGNFCNISIADICTDDS